MEQHAENHAEKKHAFLGHLREMAMAKIIQTSKQPMTCWAVLQSTTTIKVSGSIIGLAP